MRALVALACLATPAYAELEHVDPATAPDAAPLTGNAVVWADARLYLDPADTAPSVQVATLLRPRKDSVGHVMVVRVVGSDKGFVQIEPTKDLDCAWTKLVSPKDLAKLRLWVKRSDLAPVLAKPFRATWKDGTRIALAAGTPLGRSKTGYIASLLGQEIGVVVPDASVGFAYKAGKVADVKSRGKKPVWLERDKTVTLGDQTITLAETWIAPNVQVRGKRVLFALEARCITAVVSVAKSDIDRDLHSGFGVGIGGEPGEYASKLGAERWLLPKGTALTSATGTATVAVTTVATEVPNPGKAATVCIERAIDLRQLGEAPHTTETKAPDRTLKLCAPASAVQHDRGSAPMP